PARPAVAPGARVYPEPPGGGPFPCGGALATPGALVGSWRAAPGSARTRMPTPKTLPVIPALALAPEAELVGDAMTDNPFPGPRPYRADEGHRFFGREELAPRLVDGI